MFKNRPQPPAPTAAAAAATLKPSAADLKSAPRASGVNPFGAKLDFSALTGAVRGKVSQYEEVAARIAADTPEAARMRALSGATAGSRWTLPPPTSLHAALAQIKFLQSELGRSNEAMRMWERKYNAEKCRALNEKLQANAADKKLATATGTGTGTGATPSKSGKSGGDAKSKPVETGNKSIELNSDDVRLVLSAMANDRVMRAQKIQALEPAITAFTKATTGVPRTSVAVLVDNRSRSPSMSGTVSGSGGSDQLTEMEFKVEDVDAGVCGLEHELLHEIVVLEYVKDHIASPTATTSSGSGGASSAAAAAAAEKQVQIINAFESDLRAELVDLQSKWSENRHHSQNASRRESLVDLCSSLPREASVSYSAAKSPGNSVKPESKAVVCTRVPPPVSSVFRILTCLCFVCLVYGIFGRARHVGSTGCIGTD